MSSEETDPATQRAEMLERWERAAAGWGRRAHSLRTSAMPVSVWMLDHAGLQPGQRVLELAAGPGDTGFLAAELIRPGTLICSDAAEAMLEVAKERARELGIENVEFRRLELEWIDLPTASVDAILCRWGLMLTLDPAAALQEARRVLRPGGRLALAVWDDVSRNPWATIPNRALIEHGHAKPPEPGEPGPFALSAPGELRGLIESAGFLDVLVEAVDVARHHSSLDEFIAETLDLSMMFSGAFTKLSEAEQNEVKQTMASLAAPFTGADGAIALPGTSLGAAAHA